MRLSSIQSKVNRFVLLELDDVRVMADAAGLDFQSTVNQDLLRRWLSQLWQAAQASVSGVLVDSDLGLPLVSSKKKGAGLILSLEMSSVEQQPSLVPQLRADWGVEQIKNNYAVAKLELNYHPGEAEALAKKQLVAEIHDFCRYQEIDFLLELIVYPQAGQKWTKAEFQSTQLAAVQELRSECELLSLESPQEPLAAATLTAELDIPWILSSSHLPYDAFKNDLRQALENGAAGCLMSDSLWVEMFQLRQADKRLDEAVIEQFIQTTVRDRMIEVARIVAEAPQIT